jgi:hypothetical protein
MAKLIILFFFTIGSGVTYLTYSGIGQEKIETTEHETVRSNSSHGSSSGGSWGSSGSSYNSSSYGYGK